jgi:F-type H+-transporting ATPase subunit epsilon
VATIEVHVVAPEREVWAGQAQMVIADGQEGRVGILPGHAPMLIRLAIAPMRIQDEDGHWVWAVVDGGFLHVTSGEGGSRVDVLATHAEMAQDIDAVAARARVEELQRRLAEHADAEVAAELAKAHARASLGS